MDDEPKDEEPTQRTPEGAERERLGLPGEGGREIPVPKRADIEQALAKAVAARRQRAALRKRLGGTEE